jgi:branched-chain amino acid transport system substrate-binding protein
MTIDLLNHGGKAIEGANLVNFYNNEYMSNEYKEFVNAYNSEFGAKPGFSAQFSYEAITVLAEALVNSKDISSSALKNYIISQSTFKGLQGELVFNKFGDVSREAYNYEIQNGEFVIQNLGKM